MTTELTPADLTAIKARYIPKRHKTSMDLLQAANDLPRLVESLEKAWARIAELVAADKRR